MTYTVVWQPTAEAMLAELWMQATDRNAVAAAADRIDALLEQDADTAGESRSGTRRVLFDPPLGVHFEVREETHTVYVLRV